MRKNVRQIIQQLLDKKGKQPTPHTQPTLDQMRMITFVTQGCEKGKCLSCSEHCIINHYRAILSTLKRKPSFCRGRYGCKRLRVKGYSCKRCKWEHVDLNIVSCYDMPKWIPLPKPKPITKPAIDVSEIENLCVTQ